MDVQDAKKRLRYGNDRYASGERIITSPSGPLRTKLVDSKQKPYAAILTCSDARVIPEAIFGATAGELYVVRNEGNCASESAIASLQFAVEVLEVEYILVLGHNNCNSVQMAVSDVEYEGSLGASVNRLRKTLGGNKDVGYATTFNTCFSSIMVRNALAGRKVTVEAALLDLGSGKVSYIQ